MPGFVIRFIGNCVTELKSINHKEHKEGTKHTKSNTTIKQYNK